MGLISIFSACSEKKNTAADDSQGDKLDGKGCICFFLSLNWG